MAMGWSVRRRLIYLAAVGGFIFAGVAGLWYSRLPAPSCQDGKLNQNELAVDCGGVCARVCPFEVKPLREVWSRLFQIDPDRYDEVTFLRNPNRNFAARLLRYRIRILDDQEALVSTRDGEAYLNPGESLPLYHSRIEVGNRLPRRAVFEITDGPVWQRQDPLARDLKVNFKSFTNEPTPSLTAEVVNDSLATLKDLTVVGLLADEEENVMAVSSTLIEQIGRAEKREIVFTWPRPLAKPPTFHYFYPHFNPAGLR